MNATHLSDCPLCRGALRLRPRLHPRHPPGCSWALTPGCHPSCSPWSPAVSGAKNNKQTNKQKKEKLLGSVASTLPEIVRIASKKVEKKSRLLLLLLLWLTRASWLHAKGTSLQKQGSSSEEGQWCTRWGSHTWFSPPLPLTSLPLRCLATPPTRGATASRARQMFWPTVIRFFCKLDNF